MSLHIFSDQCVPAEITDKIRARGHRITLVREVMSIRSPDSAVIAKAQSLGAVLLSLNGDFSDIVRYPPAQYGGIVGVQLHNHPETIPHLMALLLPFLEAHPTQEFYRGKLILAEVHRLRIRQ